MPCFSFPFFALPPVRVFVTLNRFHTVVLYTRIYLYTWYILCISYVCICSSAYCNTKRSISVSRVFFLSEYVRSFHLFGTSNRHGHAGSPGCRRGVCVHNQANISTRRHSAQTTTVSARACRFFKPGEIQGPSLWSPKKNNEERTRASTSTTTSMNSYG